MSQPFDAILDYWFGPQENGFPVQSKATLWWQGSTETDDEIRNTFGALVEQALQGELDHWQQIPQGCLALIILLDQFTRNIYRGRAQAFSGDAHAYGIAQRGLAQQMDLQLSFSERLFFYMPLEHAEDEAAQAQCLHLLEALNREVPSEHRATLESNLSFARAHADVIAQFGRFPHRNQVLGRESTASELEYLYQSPNRWGQ